MKQEPLYRQALTNAWQLAWRHKLLWLFGFFAAFLGQMGLSELVMKIGMTGTKYAFFPKMLTWSTFSEISLSGGGWTMPLASWLWLGWLMLVICGFFLVLIFVSISSQGAIIKAASKYAKGKRLPSVDEAWKAGTSHFWRLLAINVLKKAIIMLLGVSLAYGTINIIIRATTLDMVLFVSLFVLSVIVGLLLSFLTVYAAGYVVVEEYSLGKALASAWRLFINHWLVSIEVGVILFILNILLGALILASFFVLFIPTLLLWVVAFTTINVGLYFVATFVGIALFVLFIIFTGSVFTVFSTSAWTYLFMHMHKVGLKSRILHWFGFRS